MGIVLWIVFGALSGWIASMIMKSSGGMVWDIVMGIIGALVGGFLLSIMGQAGVSGFNLYSLMVAVFGACVTIFVGRMLRTN